MDKDFNKKVFESFPDSVWTGEVPRADYSPRRINVIRLAFEVAAAACIAIMAVILLRKPQEAEPLAQAVRPEIVYTVNPAVRAQIVLPDSTAVTLNCGSRITLEQDFGKTNRTVYLDGEALFDVHKQRTLPFIVNTPQGVEVKVTGTKFNMSCYSDNSLFDLTLLQGSVEVTTSKKEVLRVKPSEQILIKDGFLNISKIAEPEEELEWTEGILSFNHTPMREAIQRIEKWYGVQIKVEDEGVYRNSITGEFRSEPLEEVLHLICLTSRLSYTISDKTVTIRSAK
jgi:ferric-dicitrate binding protein FerR (iron transport regulator)